MVNREISERLRVGTDFSCPKSGVPNSRGGEVDKFSEDLIIRGSAYSEWN